MEIKRKYKKARNSGRSKGNIYTLHNPARVRGENKGGVTMITLKSYGGTHTVINGECRQVFNTLADAIMCIILLNAKV